jgi:hypothetical protein
MEHDVLHVRLVVFRLRLTGIDEDERDTDLDRVEQQ